MDNILETYGQRGACVICVFHTVSVELNIMKENRCLINACRKNQAKFGMKGPRMGPASFPVPGAQEALGTHVMWADV